MERDFEADRCVMGPECPYSPHPGKECAAAEGCAGFIPEIEEDEEGGEGV